MKPSLVGAACVVFVIVLLTSCGSGFPAPPGSPSAGSGDPLRSVSTPAPQVPQVSATPSTDSTTGIIPSSLRRPLHLPSVATGDACPTSSGRTYTNSQFGGISLGSGPVLPLVGVARERDGGAAKEGVLRVRPYADYPGWLFVKTLWFSFPRYQGPVLLRGRQLDGSQDLAMGEPPTIDPELTAGATANGEEGFREWPGGTWVKGPGCYAWQVDGLDFSYVIVFKAEVAA
jgi:hypothetical protein